MGVRSGQVGGVFKPVFDSTKTKGGRRTGLASMQVGDLVVVTRNGVSFVVIPSKLPLAV